MPEPLTVLTYPKSGRTWLRFMICEYMARKLEHRPLNRFDLEEHEALRHITWTHGAFALSFENPWTELEPIHIQLPMANNGNVLLLLRNVYAVLASSYIWCVHRLQNFQGSFDSFLNDPRFGIAKATRAYCLMNRWCHKRIHDCRDAKSSKLPSTYVITYEELQRDTVRTLHHTLMFLDLATPRLGGEARDTERKHAERAVEASHLVTMRELGRTEAYRGSHIHAPQGRIPDAGLVRTGGFHTARGLFTLERIERVQHQVAQLLLDLDTAAWMRCLEVPEALKEPL